MYYTNTGWYAVGAPLYLRVLDNGVWGNPITISNAHDGGVDSRNNIWSFTKKSSGQTDVYLSSGWYCCTQSFINGFKVFTEGSNYAYRQTNSISNKRWYYENTRGDSVSVASDGRTISVNNRVLTTLPANEYVNENVWIDEAGSYVIANTSTNSRVFDAATGQSLVNNTGKFIIPANGLQIVADGTVNPRKIYVIKHQTNVAPVASFTNTINGMSVNFVNTSTNGVNYSWTFSNGQTSTAQNPSVTFTNAGTYTACLTVSNGCNSRQICQEVRLSCAIANVAISGNSAICQGGNTTLTASGGTAYVWSNGATTPSINVITGGNYTVTATNATGCLGTTNLNVTVNPRPKADFGFNIQGGKSQFTSISTDTNNTTVYRWDLGNGTTSNLKNPIGNYSTNGNYTICLWVTNTTGCKDSICKQINVTRVATQDLSNDLKVEIYPNPTTGHFTLKLQNNTSLKSEVTLFNTLGQIILKQDLINNIGQFDVSSMTSAIYLIKIRTEKKEIWRKIIVNR